MYVDNPNEATVQAGASIWAISLTEVAGADYLNKIPYFTLEGWEALLDVLMGFCDIDRAWEEDHARAQGRRDKRVANGATGCGRELRLTQVEKACKRAFEKKDEYRAACLVHTGTIVDAFKRLAV